ncbi:MAG: GNAT family N-acetyltransferase [Candidatus Gastranaerophilaceae bacterium]|jgi:hypothetical protein
MAKIRNIYFWENLKRKNFNDYINYACFSKSKYENLKNFFPVNFIHNFLPVNLKFLEETYVAVEEGQIIGTISLEVDGSDKTRWKINSLMLKENSIYLAKQLVDFVVNKYGAVGIEVFLAIVNETDSEVISLFKEACGFRTCAGIQIRKNENPISISFSYNPDNFRNYKENDLDELVEINTRNLFTQFRPTLLKSKADFKRAYLLSGNNNVLKILTINDKIAGYFKIFTTNETDFWLDAVVSEPYIQYYPDILGYARDFILEKNKNTVLYVYAKKYRQTCLKFIEVLDSGQFATISTNHVLVKDYWKPLKINNDVEEKAFRFFKDMSSPACFQPDPGSSK